MRSSRGYLRYPPHSHESTSSESLLPAPQYSHSHYAAEGASNRSVVYGNKFNRPACLPDVPLREYYERTTKSGYENTNSRHTRDLSLANNVSYRDDSQHSFLPAYECRNYVVRERRYFSDVSARRELLCIESPPAKKRLSSKVVNHSSYGGHRVSSSSSDDLRFPSRRTKVFPPESNEPLWIRNNSLNEAQYRNLRCDSPPTASTNSELLSARSFGSGAYRTENIANTRHVLSLAAIIDDTVLRQHLSQCCSYRGSIHQLTLEPDCLFFSNDDSLLNKLFAGLETRGGKGKMRGLQRLSCLNLSQLTDVDFEALCSGLHKTGPFLQLRSCALGTGVELPRARFFLETLYKQTAGLDSLTLDVDVPAKPSDSQFLKTFLNVLCWGVRKLGFRHLRSEEAIGRVLLNNAHKLQLGRVDGIKLSSVLVAQLSSLVERGDEINTHLMADAAIVTPTLYRTVRCTDLLACVAGGSAGCFMSVIAALMIVAPRILIRLPQVEKSPLLASMYELMESAGGRFVWGLLDNAVDLNDPLNARRALEIADNSYLSERQISKCSESALNEDEKQLYHLLRQYYHGCEIFLAWKQQDCDMYFLYEVVDLMLLRRRMHADQAGTPIYIPVLKVWIPCHEASTGMNVPMTGGCFAYGEPLDRVGSQVSLRLLTNDEVKSAVLNMAKYKQYATGAHIISEKAVLPNHLHNATTTAIIAQPKEIDDMEIEVSSDEMSRSSCCSDNEDERCVTAPSSQASLLISAHIRHIEPYIPWEEMSAQEQQPTATVLPDDFSSCWVQIDLEANDFVPEKEPFPHLKRTIWGVVVPSTSSFRETTNDCAVIACLFNIVSNNSESLGLSFSKINEHGKEASIRCIRAAAGLPLLLEVPKNRLQPVAVPRSPDAWNLVSVVVANMLVMQPSATWKAFFDSVTSGCNGEPYAAKIENAVSQALRVNITEELSRQYMSVKKALQAENWRAPLCNSSNGGMSLEDIQNCVVDMQLNDVTLEEASPVEEGCVETKAAPIEMATPGDDEEPSHKGQRRGYALPSFFGLKLDDFHSFGIVAHRVKLRLHPALIETLIDRRQHEEEAIGRDKIEISQKVLYLASQANPRECLGGLGARTKEVIFPTPPFVVDIPATSEPETIFPNSYNLEAQPALRSNNLTTAEVRKEESVLAEMGFSRGQSQELSRDTRNHSHTSGFRYRECCSDSRRNMQCKEPFFSADRHSEVPDSRGGHYAASACDLRYVERRRRSFTLKEGAKNVPVRGFSQEGRRSGWNMAPDVAEINLHSDDGRDAEFRVRPRNMHENAYENTYDDRKDFRSYSTGRVSREPVQGSDYKGNRQSVMYRERTMPCATVDGYDGCSTGPRFRNSGVQSEYSEGRGFMSQSKFDARADARFRDEAIRNIDRSLSNPLRLAEPKPTNELTRESLFEPETTVQLTSELAFADELTAEQHRGGGSSSSTRDAPKRKRGSAVKTSCRQGPSLLIERKPHAAASNNSAGLLGPSPLALSHVSSNDPLSAPMDNEVLPADNEISSAAPKRSISPVEKVKRSETDVADKSQPNPSTRRRLVAKRTFINAQTSRHSVLPGDSTLRIKADETSSKIDSKSGFQQVVPTPCLDPSSETVFSETRESGSSPVDDLDKRRARPLKTLPSKDRKLVTTKELGGRDIVSMNCSSADSGDNDTIKLSSSFLSSEDYEGSEIPRKRRLVVTAESFDRAATFSSPASVACTPNSQNGASCETSTSLFAIEITTGKEDNTALTPSSESREGSIESSTQGTELGEHGSEDKSEAQELAPAVTSRKRNSSEAHERHCGVPAAEIMHPKVDSVKRVSTEVEIHKGKNRTIEERTDTTSGKQSSSSVRRSAKSVDSSNSHIQSEFDAEPISRKRHATRSQKLIRRSRERAPGRKSKRLFDNKAGGPVSKLHRSKNASDHPEPASKASKRKIVSPCDASILSDGSEADSADIPALDSSKRFQKGLSKNIADGTGSPPKGTMPSDLNSILTRISSVANGPNLSSDTVDDDAWTEPDLPPTCSLVVDLDGQACFSLKASKLTEDFFPLTAEALARLFTPMDAATHRQIKNREMLRRFELASAAEKNGKGVVDVTDYDYSSSDESFENVLTPLKSCRFTVGNGRTVLSHLLPNVGNESSQPLELPSIYFSKHQKKKNVGTSSSKAESSRKRRRLSGDIGCNVKRKQRPVSCNDSTGNSQDECPVNGMRCSTRKQMSQNSRDHCMSDSASSQTAPSRHWLRSKANKINRSAAPASANAISVVEKCARESRTNPMPRSVGSSIVRTPPVSVRFDLIEEDLLAAHNVKYFAERPEFQLSTPLSCDEFHLQQKGKTILERIQNFDRWTRQRISNDLFMASITKHLDSCCERCHSSASLSSSAFVESCELLAVWPSLCRDCAARICPRSGKRNLVDTLQLITRITDIATRKQVEPLSDAEVYSAGELSEVLRDIHRHLTLLESAKEKSVRVSSSHAEESAALRARSIAQLSPTFDALRAETANECYSSSQAIMARALLRTNQRRAALAAGGGALPAYRLSVKQHHNCNGVKDNIAGTCLTACTGASFCTELTETTAVKASTIVSSRPTLHSALAESARSLLERKQWRTLGRRVLLTFRAGSDGADTELVRLAMQYRTEKLRLEGQWLNKLKSDWADLPHYQNETTRYLTGLASKRSRRLRVKKGELLCKIPANTEDACQEHREITAATKDAPPILENEAETSFGAVEHIDDQLILPDQALVNDSDSQRFEVCNEQSLTTLKSDQGERTEGPNGMNENITHEQFCGASIIDPDTTRSNTPFREVSDRPLSDDDTESPEAKYSARRARPRRRERRLIRFEPLPAAPTNTIKPPLAFNEDYCSGPTDPFSPSEQNYVTPSCPAYAGVGVNTTPTIVYGTPVEPKVDDVPTEVVSYEQPWQILPATSAPINYNRLQKSDQSEGAVASNVNDDKFPHIPRSGIDNTLIPKLTRQLLEPQESLQQKTPEKQHARRATRGTESLLCDHGTIVNEGQSQTVQSAQLTTWDVQKVQPIQTGKPAEVREMYTNYRAQSESHCATVAHSSSDMSTGEIWLNHNSNSSASRKRHMDATSVNLGPDITNSPVVSAKEPDKRQLVDIRDENCDHQGPLQNGALQKAMQPCKEQSNSQIQQETAQVGGISSAAAFLKLIATLPKEQRQACVAKLQELQSRKHR